MMSVLRATGLLILMTEALHRSLCYVLAFIIEGEDRYKAGDESLSLSPNQC